MGYEYPVKDPFFVQWHITNRCHLRCRHCYQDDFTGAADLDWKGLERIAANLLETVEGWGRAATIHLTGGEPLLKKELFRLLEHLGEREVVEELGVITNGLLLDREMVRRLSGCRKLRTIKVSLDGARAETHDAIRSEGSFEKVLRNMEGLRRESRFETVFMFTLMKKNLREVPALLRLCERKGVEGLILERFVPIGQGREAMDQVLDRGDWKSLVHMLSDRFSIEEEEAGLLSYQAFQIRFRQGEEPELLGAPCVVGSDGLCLMPDGTVFPCRRLPIPIGNLLREPLRVIWEGSEVLRLVRDRSNLKGRCKACDVAACRGCRSLALALTGDYLAEDPHCPYQP